MNFDTYNYRYPSRRSVVYGTKGMVCTSQTLAAQAGLDVLKKGGNAVDAIIATASCLTVLVPCSNGLGSDAFALYWDAKTKKLYGINGSGYAPAKLTVEAVQSQFNNGDVQEQSKNGTMKCEPGKMPKRGWGSMTVPGAVSTWAELHKRFGRKSFESLFDAAITCAEEGYPVSPLVAYEWALADDVYKDYKTQTEFKPLYDTFFANGAPQSGEIVKLPHHGRALREIAKTNGESFYRGAIADAIDAFSTETGGFIRKEDLANYRAEWVEPIRTKYHGYEVCEIPPNGQGIVALMALNILEQLDMEQGHHDDADTIHKQLEAMKLAFTDGKTYVADPKYMKQMTVAHLLSGEYAASRVQEIGTTASSPKAIDPLSGGTVYLCAADSEGNMISFIQSNYMGFGSGIVLPGYGVAFNNRASDFSLNLAADNYLVPGKKPYHTIIPGFLIKQGEAVGPFGVMGAYMQPQGHVQVLMNMLHFGMNPQEALDAPRWQWTGDKYIEIEPGFGESIAQALIAKGHDVNIQPDFISFGRGQIIVRDENGVLMGATEPRADGCVASW